MHSCNLKIVVISHINTLFKCCLFNLSAFRAVILSISQLCKFVAILLSCADIRSPGIEACNYFLNEQICVVTIFSESLVFRLTFVKSETF